MKTWMLVLLFAASSAGCAVNGAGTLVGESGAAKPSPGPRTRDPIPPDEHPQHEQTNPAD